MLWRLVQSPARYSECLLPVSPNGSNSRMLICIACRNGDVPAKICVKSLEKKGVSVLHENLRLKRKERGLSQEELASRLHVVRQTISKWEKGKGFPDISLIEPLANVLQVSIPELLSGEQIINTNRSANILKSNLYVCPICGNIFHSTGSAMVSCCGVTLPALEAEQADEEHQIKCEKIEDEFFISMQHPMTKEHYISFVVYCTGERFESVKLYPESSIEVRFFSRGHGTLYWYCNHHGLFKKRI